jgi:ketosteroid isomerase-like protein
MRMIAKLIPALALTLMTPISAYSQTLHDDLVARESTAFGFLVGSHADISRYMTLAAPDYLLVDPAGAIYTADETAAAFKACKLDAYQISDITVRSLSSTSALAIVKVKLDGTCAGQRLPPDYVMTDAWVKHADKWLIQTHTETLVVAQK